MQVHEIGTDTTWTINENDITVMIRSDNGASCYTCGTEDLSEGLFDSGGIACCWGCALKYETRKGIPATAIPTDEQRETEAAWRAAGIGIN